MSKPDVTVLCHTQIEHFVIELLRFEYEGHRGRSYVAYASTPHDEHFIGCKGADPYKVMLALGHRLGVEPPSVRERHPRIRCPRESRIGSLPDHDPASCADDCPIHGTPPDER